MSIGGVPAHAPGSAVSVEPCSGVPVTVGRSVFDGGTASTRGVGSDVAVSSPAALRAVTTTRRRSSTSVAVATYLPSVAPAIGPQLSPRTSQRSHRYAKVISGVPVHAPVSAVSVSPARGAPVIPGRSVLRGATGATASVVVDEAVRLPAALRAVTS